jgi:hypothetical protein
MKRSLRLATALLAGVLATVGACDCGAPPQEGASPLGDGFARLEATGAETVVLRFARPVDETTVGGASFTIENFTVVPPETVAVSSAALTAPDVLTLSTATMTPGKDYTLTVAGLRDLDGFEIAGTLNFTAPGVSVVATVEIRVDDVETARLHEDLALLATVASETGAFSERLQLYPLVDEGDAFVATLQVAVDTNRTLDRSDDGDPEVDRRPYGLRLVDGAGRMASPLTVFTVEEETGTTVWVDVLPPPEEAIIIDPEEPLPPPPEDATPGDGKKPVLVVVDDRASGELVSPALKVSFGSDGGFDSSFPRSVDLTPLEGYEGYWGVVVEVAVDENRTADGQTEATFPYFGFLVEDGVEYEGLSVALTAPDETPQTVRLSLGNAEWTPVTFRVDASQAYLDLEGDNRGVWPGEAVFLTGEWQVAVDALGNNAGDAFSGGEQLNLKMNEDPDHAGVWTRTLWLPPGRPYGWKVVRCDATTGCGPLNQLVASSGRAFATVMKNLVTDNVDAFGDAMVGLVDPLDPENTEAGGQTWDYSGASVYEGTGVGAEPDPSGTPDGALMFKQEVPDLVVVVEEGQPIQTRIFHVGTWRDVNIGQSPTEIIAAQSPVELGPFDYDDGTIGRYPPSREDP